MSKQRLPLITLVLTFSAAEGFILTVIPGDVRTVLLSTRFDAVRGAFQQELS